MFSRVIERMLNFTHVLKSFHIHLYVCTSLNWVVDETSSACVIKLYSRRVMVFNFLRSRCSFFPLCVNLPLNLPTKCAPFAVSSQIYGYWVELWFRPFANFCLFLYTTILNPEVPKYHKQREFFWYFKLEQK